MEQKYNKIIENLMSFFGAKAIGSYLFYLSGDLKFEDLNDIDIIVESSKREGLANYLESIGYQETILNGKQVGYAQRSVIWEKLPQGDFKDKVNESPLTIHVQVSSDMEVYLEEEIISNKFKRGEKRDFITINKIVKSKLDKLTKDE